jgi:hypothetical protein
MGFVEFDTDKVTLHVAGGDERRSRTVEGVEHRIARLREGLDDRIEDRDRLLRRMLAVA